MDMGCASNLFPIEENGLPSSYPNIRWARLIRRQDIEVVAGLERDVVGPELPKQVQRKAFQKCDVLGYAPSSGNFRDITMALKLPKKAGK